MAFPASSTTPAAAWQTITAKANRIKDRVQQLRDLSAAGDTGRSSYLALQRQINETVVTWDSLTGTPGLQAYARGAVDDDTLDLVAEYQAMRTAAITLRDWIYTALPRSGGGVPVYDYDQEGNPTEILVSTAAAAGFRTAADTFTATIA